LEETIAERCIVVRHSRVTSLDVGATTVALLDIVNGSYLHLKLWLINFDCRERTRPEQPFFSFAKLLKRKNKIPHCCSSAKPARAFAGRDARHTGALAASHVRSEDFTQLRIDTAFGALWLPYAGSARRFGGHCSLCGKAMLRIVGWVYRPRYCLPLRASSNSLLVGRCFLAEAQRFGWMHL
jgi:hypothetical protein